MHCQHWLTTSVCLAQLLAIRLPAADTGVGNLNTQLAPQMPKNTSLSGLRKTKRGSSGSCKKKGGKSKQKHQVHHEVVAGESYCHTVVQ